MRPRLVTIPISHYCERARWALDLAQVDYDEAQHLQFFGWIAAWRVGRRKTVPVFVHEGGALADSQEIVQWASARMGDLLYPPDCRADVEALDQELAGKYGDATRRIAYAWFFRNLDACLAYNFGAAPPLQVGVMRFGRPLAVRFAARYVGVGPDALGRTHEVVHRTLDALAERCKDGRKYLCGDRFTAADLTFASLSGPSVLPPRYGMPLPPIEVLDEPARQWIQTMREHPAGALALRLYEERPPVRARLPRPLAASPPRSALDHSAS